MINSTSVMWTCLPNGVLKTSTGAIATPLTLQLSIYVTPRIAATASTDTINGTVFQNWGALLENWPAQIRAITAAKGWNIAFSETGNNAPSVTVQQDYLSPGYPSGSTIDAVPLWNAIFPASTPVLAPSTVAPSFKINSYSASTIATAVREAHRHVVASQSATGKIQKTANDPYTLLMSEQAKARYALPRVAKALGRVKRGPTHHALSAAYQAEMGELGLGYELVRHALFYDRGGYRARARGAATNGHFTPQAVGVSPIDGTSNPNDFNTILAHLGGQPELLRKLGLVIDLLVVPPQNIVTQLLATPTTFSISTAFPPPPGPNWWGTAANVYNMQPITLCDITTSSFVATQYATTAGLTEMTSGMLPLNTSQFAVSIEDTEGTPVKLEIASTGKATAGTGAVDNAAPMPALRTMGFTVTQNTRELAMQSAFDSQETITTGFFTGPNGNPGAAQLRAQDLVRGYRVDVAVMPSSTTTPATPTTAAAFQSLCLRDSRVYCPTTGANLLFSDEGYIKGSAGTSPLAAGSEELDLHEAVFGWEGWSLASPRPGRAITATADADPAVQDEALNQPLNTPAGLYPTVEITVRPRAATLPRLRFGNWYSFRARMTDLAGNDMSVPGAVVCSPPVQYLRYEPVPNPVLVLEAPLTEGEHIERLVIRSNPWGATPQNAAAYATSPPATPMNPYTVPNTRWIAPPKGAWAAAEAHGRFDTYFNEMSAAMKAPGAAPAPGVGYENAAFVAAKSTLYTLSQKESGTFNDTSVWDTFANKTQTNPVKIVIPASAQQLPPTTLRGAPPVPGQYPVLSPAAGQAVYIPYFPDPNAAGVCLNTYAAYPSGLVAIGLPMIRTWAPRPGASWPEINLPQLQLQEGTVFGVAGLDTALSTPPSTNVPIVVSLPAGQQVVLQSSSTLVDATKMANYDAGATAQISTYAPNRQITLVHAVQQPKPPGPPGGPSGLTAAPRTPGQSNVALSGTIVADGATSSHLDLTASWTEWVDTELTPGVTVEANGIRRVQKTGRVQTWTLAATDTDVAIATTPALYHEFGDTKTRLVTYGAVATSRFREYFPAALQTNSANFTNSNLQNTTAPNTPAPTRVLSTARPPPPSVLYVVPTYQWGSSTVSGTTTNTRLGGGLRVYVDRPWFVSGDGEYLAVLVGTGAVSATLNDYVSQWGYDPILNPQNTQPLTPFTESLVMTSDVIAGGVPLAEGLGSVAVHGYAPAAFDSTRGLWYFDIEVASSTLEAPFVRLALARFQPNSLLATATNADLRLSTVVRADMVKLSQDRSAAYVTNASTNAVSITVTGQVFSNVPWTPGNAFTKNYFASGRVVVAQVQETTVANPGEFDWVPVGAQVLLNGAQSGGNASTEVVFTGTVPMPTGLKAGAKHQLLLTELELFSTDAEVKFPQSQTPAPTNYPTGQFQTADSSVHIVDPNSTSRVIFSDIVSLPY